MSALGKALKTARYVGKCQAQEWLYRQPAAVLPHAELAAWRATCYADAVHEYEHERDFLRLLHAWATAFDRAIENSKTVAAGPVITRAVIVEDIWATANWTSSNEDSPPVLLARKGDVVNVQPSPFAQWPLTIIPRSGPAFCAKHTQVSALDVVQLPESAFDVDGGRHE